MLFFLITTLFIYSNIWINITKHLATAPLGDKGTNLWNLWWVYYAVFEKIQSPLWCDIVFYPWGIDLRHHTLSLSNGLIAAPLTAFLGANVTYNVLFLTWTFLTAVFAAMWARMFNIGITGALLVGFWAAFGPFRVEHIIHLNLFSTHWMFLSFLFIERAIQNKKWYEWFGFCIAWLLTTFSSFYFCLFVGIYWIIRMLIHGCINKQNINSNFWYGFVPILMVLISLFLYFYFPSAPPDVPFKIVADDVSIQYSVYWSLDILHFLMPALLLQQFDLAPYEPEFNIHPGILSILLSFVGLLFIKKWKMEREKFWFIFSTMVIFFLLSLGPILKIAGEVVTIMGYPIFLPAFVFEFVPKLTSIRVYSRFAYIGFMLLTLMAAYGLSYIFNHSSRLNKLFIFICLVVYLFFYGYNINIKMTDYDHVGPYLLSEKQNIVSLEGPILEVPYEPTKLSGLHLYHQIHHQQPIFVAEFSRLGEYKKQYLTNFSWIHDINMNIKSNNTFQDEFRENCESIETLNISHMWISTIPEKIDKIDQTNDQNHCNEVQIQYYDLEAGVK